MLKPVPLWMAVRYLGAQRANPFASLVAIASVAGVALGVAALIVVLSVMNGFENELRTRLVAISGHAAILTGAEGADWRDVLADAASAPGVTAVTPYVELEAMIATGGELSGAVIEGIDPATAADFPGIDRALRGGSLDSLVAGSWQALLGRSLALRLGVGPGDRLRVLVPVRDEGGQVNSRLREFTVAGEFEVGVKDQDGVRMLVHLADAQSVAGLHDRVTGVRVRVADVFAARTIIADWARRWGQAGHVVPATTDWTRDNATYFRAVRIEKVMMTLLLSLIVAVAAFNIVATLVMLVTDRRAGIAILRTLGFSRRAIVGTFALQGLLIGWTGVLAGVAAGVVLARNVDTLAPALERVFGFQFMPADVYYLTALPSDLQLDDILWVGMIALLMTGCATIYPALRAAAVAPAEVLRYE